MAVRITARGNPDSVIQRAIITESNRLGPELTAQIMGVTPVGDENPSYRSAKESWHWAPTQSGFRVYNISGHAKYSEFGTDTPILPKNGRYLTFYSYGVKYTAKQVRGQRAQRYVLRVLQRVFGANNVREDSGGYSV